MAEAIALASIQETETAAAEPSDEQSEPPTADPNNPERGPSGSDTVDAAEENANHGKLIADATYAPAALCY